MQLQCSRCQLTVDVDGDAPHSCAQCGEAFPTNACCAGDSTLIEADFIYSPDSPPVIAESVCKQAPLNHPPQIGGYRLLQRLGSGGMGSVYEAEDLASGQKVAVKLIRSKSTLIDHSAVQRFRQEGRLASTLTHPRCVFVLTADEDQGQPYIVMELMPGRTLADLIGEKGPLGYREAVQLILDVIEGLQEAHRLGLVHRDVKPSNCFLDNDGRVKIGDFGLAKTLRREPVPSQVVRIAHDGAFMGTPLYAAPEQIQGDTVGHQADVYSVTATLYFLLTGRAPFEAACSTEALLARIICDEPIPVTKYRQDLPAALVKILERGLERDCSRRFPDLDSLRQALFAFQPRRQGIVRLGLRVTAFLLDLIVILLLIGLVRGLLAYVSAWNPNNRLWQWLADEEMHPVAGAILLALFCQAMFFALPEYLWGCSLGKWCFRLRVHDPAHNQRPTLVQVFVRNLIFLLMVQGGYWGWLFYQEITRSPITDAATRAATPSARQSMTLAVEFLSFLAGAALLTITMRGRTGYRGVHEWASGTATVQLLPAPPLMRHDLSTHTCLFLLSAESLTEPLHFGRFTATHVLWRRDDQTLYAGKDPRLQRGVWIWVRPRGCCVLSPQRRRVARAGRLRWLASGLRENHHWDAFLSTPGATLPDASRDHPLEWSCAYQLLRELTQELEVSRREGSLPDHVSLEHVWLQARGQVQLLDTPAMPRHDGVVSTEQNLLNFVSQVATTALTGRSIPIPEKLPLTLPRAIPVKAYGLLERLRGHGKSFESLAQLQDELSQLELRPFSVTRWWRFRTLVVQGFWFVVMMLLTYGLLAPLDRLLQDPATEMRNPTAMARTVLPLVPFVALLLLTLWTWIWRGRAVFGTVGLALRNKQGGPVDRWRAALRLLLVGVPATTLFWLARTPWRFSIMGVEIVGLPLICVSLILLQAILVLRQPSRAWHDRIAGTMIVPE